MRQAFTVEGLCCAKCAAEIEEGVGRIIGCESANMAFMTKKLTIEAPEEDMERITAETELIVRRIEPKASVKRR
ncbi:MAG: cation transporter [Candidatus Methanomethylophilaceae archaeon]|nr:cation transporter [Candidatus Methanomethylophilaceae archaeon]